MNRFWTFGRPYAARYGLGFVLLLATNGLHLALPWLLREAVNAMESGAALGRVARLAAAMAGLALAQAAVRTVSRLMILGASRRVVHDVRERFFAHLQRLGGSFYDAQRTGDLMSRGVNDVQLIQSFFGPGVMNLLNTAIVYVAVLTLLLRIDAGLTLVSLTVYPALLLGVQRFSRAIYARSFAVQEQLAAISSRAQENLSGIRQVKTYVQEDREIDGFRALCAEFRSRSLAMAATRGGMIAVIGVATGAATLIVLFVGGRHVIEGRIRIGDFVAFHAYLALLARPTIAMGWIVNVFQRGAGAMRRVGELLERQPDVPVPDERDARGEDTVSGDIEIRGLTFSYGEPAAGTHSLRDVHLHIPRGSRVALVGPVGSGKSTLVNLLARVYPVPQGTVFLGGQDINDIPIARLRRSLGYVLQEPFLFSRSIRENIAFRDPEIGDEAVMRAVELSRLGADVDSFPHGLDTVVGERGFTLSGGQRQRATLARALVGDPPILILDDALSSVDADTEREILDQLHADAGGRTCLFVTHRPSTLGRMDRIVVLDHGRVVEDGTHDELLARDGLYAGLFRREQLERRLR